MHDRYFPSYTIGKNAFSKFNDVCKKLGHNFLMVGGETALSVAADKLLENISESFNLIDKVIYGKECYEDRVLELYNMYKEENTDFVVGVGGGKAIDTSKYLAHLLGVPIITVPTIASTCAAASALSVVYSKNHAFEKFVHYKKPAFHCFIDTEIIANAPYEFLRAGIGDTLAKHYEVEFSSRGRNLDYSSEFGLTLSSMCNTPLKRNAVSAIAACKANKINNELENVVLAIIISTGIVSMLINPDYNGALAHALFYGLTNIKGFEEKFLHGDVVGYCTAVQLAVDKNMNEAKEIVKFLKSLNIETTLGERNIPCDFLFLNDVLESALNDPDMRIIPYKVTKEMLFDGICAVENL